MALRTGMLIARLALQRYTLSKEEYERESERFTAALSLLDMEEAAAKAKLKKEESNPAHR